MRLDMKIQDMEFEFLVENVRDAHVQYEDDAEECSLIRMFRANEEAKSIYLQTMVVWFERKPIKV